MTRLILATRKSMLALAQARAWGQTLIAARPDVTLEELHVVTTGDRITDRPLQEVGGKGLFLKEIEEALVDRRADFAVHSVKDVPAELAKGLMLAAIPPREDPRDVLVSRSGKRLADLPTGAKIGTSSLRRSVLLKRARPDISFVPVRGNVDTRLRKVEAGEVDAIILAYAGLRRLGLADRATEVLDAGMSIPAVGQGALGIECREDDHETAAILRATHHEETARAVACERGVMVAVEGSCQIPIAAYAVRDGSEMWVRAMLADANGEHARFHEERLAWPTSDDQARREGLRIGLLLRGLPDSRRACARRSLRLSSSSPSLAVAAAATAPQRQREVPAGRRSARCIRGRGRSERRQRGRAEHERRQPNTNGGSAGAPSTNGGSAGASTTAGAGGAPVPGTPITALEATWTWVPVDGAACGNGSPTGLGVNLSSTSEDLVGYQNGVLDIARVAATLPNVKRV